MSRSATLRRERVRAAMERAFPTATWTIYRTEVRGRYAAAIVSLSVADLYGERGCSEVTVHPRGKSPTWAVTGRATPRTGHPASIVAAARKALRQTTDLAHVAVSARGFTEGIPW